MEWLKKNYEKAVLAITALVLLACAGLIISNVQSFPEQFAGRDSSKPQDNTIKPYPTDVLLAAVDRVKNPRTWGVHDGSLFVSRPYVLKENVLIDPTESPSNLHDPITNSWLLKHGLPYWESDIKDQDPDEDRFTNLEEFLADTDPRDKASVPPYYTKLQLQKFISVPFRLIFTGSPDEGTYTINTKDRGGKTQFLKIGETIEGTPYKLLSYEPKTITKDEIEVDVSELTIENTATKQKIVLVTRKEANDPTSFGEFLYLYDNSVFKVKKDDEFTLAPEADHKYKLIDISEAEAVIKDLKTGEQHKIPSVK